MTQTYVQDMPHALASMVNRYFQIDPAVRAANLAREHKIREQMAASYYVPCHA